jgi:hypothetical protein
MGVLPLLALLPGAIATAGFFSLPSPWSYQCDRSNSSIGGHHHAARCVKVEAFKAETVQGMNACKMTCSSSGSLWPQPTGRVQVSNGLVGFLPQELRVVAVSAPSEQVRHHTAHPARTKALKPQTHIVRRLIRWSTSSPTCSVSIST